MFAIPSNWRLGRNVAWSAVLSLIVLAIVAPASVSAHTLRVTLTCENGLVVDLTDFNTSATNTVAISIDGVAVTGSPFTFDADFQNTYPVGPPTAAHTAIVAVTASDDPTGSRGWTRTFNLSIDACVEPTPTPTPGQPTPTPAEPTPTPTGGTGGATGTPPSTGGVGGATGRPAHTLPPTSTTDGDSSSPNDGWRFVLLALAGITAASLYLMPRRPEVRRSEVDR